MAVADLGVLSVPVHVHDQNVEREVMVLVELDDPAKSSAVYSCQRQYQEPRTSLRGIAAGPERAASECSAPG